MPLLRCQPAEMSNECTFSQDYDSRLVITHCAEFMISRSVFDHTEQGVSASGFEIATIKDSIFQNNYFVGKGGGCSLTGDEVVLISTCFHSCKSTDHGGAMYVVTAMSSTCHEVMVTLCESSVSPFRFDQGTEVVTNTNSTGNFASGNCAGLRLNPVGSDALAQCITCRNCRNGGVGTIILGNVDDVLEVSLLRSNVINNTGAQTLYIVTDKLVIRDSVFMKNSNPLFQIITNNEMVVECNSFDFDDLSDETAVFDVAANYMGYSGLPRQLSYAVFVGRDCILISDHNHDQISLRLLLIFLTHLSIS